MEKSIFIRHSHHAGNDSARVQDSHNGFLAMVTKCLSFNKVRPGEKPSEVYRVLNELAEKGIVDDEFKNKAISALKCGKCALIKTKCFECKCRICKHVMKEFKNDIREEMRKNSLGSYLEYADNLCCPECRQRISKEDLCMLNPSHDDYVWNRRIEETKLSAENSGTFTCFTCKRIRGCNLLPSIDIHPCLHMCKLCISKSYYKNKVKKCLECKSEINFKELIKEKFKCSTCPKENFFVGDLMIEIDPGYLLCLRCGLQTLDNNYSKISEKVLDFKVKEENYLYLYRECTECRNELLLSKLVFKECCFKYFCKKCIGNSKKCPSCN